MDLVGPFMDRKERDKLELEKKRSPAHDFQQQIKFYPKQHPTLKKESEYRVPQETQSVADPYLLI